MKSRLFGRVLTTTGLIAAAGLATSASADTVRIVGRAGDTVSIGSTNFQVSRLTTASGTLTAPVISDSGQVVYHAQLAGQALGTQHTLIRRDAAGSKLVLARSGSTWATGQPAFSTFGAPLINNIGQVAFSGGITGSGVTASNDTGFWHFDGTRVSLLAREGSQAPGATGNFSAFSDTLVAKAATNRWLSIKSTLSGSGITGTNNKAVHEMSSAGSLGALATAGLLAPGTSVNFYDPQRACNENGDVVVFSTLQGSGVTTNTSQGIWVETPSTGALTLGVRGGMSAPGAAAGSTFASLYSTNTKPQLNNSRKVVFMGSTANASGYVNGGGIWMLGSSGIVPICISGTSAPDVGLGSCLMSGGLEPSGQRGFHLCDNDDVLFWTMLSGGNSHSGNNIAMMHSRANAATGSRVIEPILRGGMQCPGAAPGVTILNSSLGQVTKVNRNGDVMFWVELQGTGIVPGTERALLKWSAGQLSMVIRNRDAIPGIDNVVLAQAGSTAPTIYMNDRGQAIMLAGSINTLTGASTNSVLTRIDEHGAVRAIGVNFNPLSLTDRSDPVVNTFVLSQNCLNNSGEFVFLTQTLETGGGDVIVMGQIEADSTPASCPADFNGDREVTQQDLFDFLSEWFLGTALGDFNHDSVIGVEDIFTFFAAWAAGGCP